MEYLTVIQKRILNFIKLYKNEKGYTPTHREIGEDHKISTPAVSKQLHQLVSKGCITMVPGKARTIVVVGDNSLVEFAKWILIQAFEGSHIFGDEAQEKAYSLGLLEVEPFDPIIHANCVDSVIFEPGDDIYIYSDELKDKQ